MKLIKRLIFGNDKPVLRNLISAILYCAALVLLDLGFRHFYTEGIVPIIDTAIPVYFTLSWTAILCAVSFLLPRIARRIFMIFTIVAYSFLALAHGFFYSFNGTYLTLSSAIFSVLLDVILPSYPASITFAASFNKAIAFTNNKIIKCVLLIKF